VLGVTEWCQLKARNEKFDRDLVSWNWVERGDIKHDVNISAGCNDKRKAHNARVKTSSHIRTNVTDDLFKMHDYYYFTYAD
jgi:hypothetical protein